MLAEYMAKLIDYKGKYAIVGDNLQFTSGRERPAGFDDGMKQYKDKGMVGVGMQLAYSDISVAQDMTQNFIKSNPDLKIVFAGNDRTTIGACNAFVQLGIKGQVKLCNVDVSLDTIKYMKAGIVQACILQKPYDMGYKGVENILDITNGKKVEKEVDTGVFLFTPDNLNTDEATAAIRQYIPKYEPDK